MNGQSAAHDFAPPLALHAYSDGQLEHFIKLMERTCELLERFVEENDDGRPRVRVRSTASPSSRTVMTRSWLRVMLKIEGPMSWAVIADKAKAQGFSNATLRKVRHDVAIKEYQDGHRVIWRLKED